MKLDEQIVSKLLNSHVEFSRLTRSGELMTFFHDERKWTLKFMDEEHAEILYNTIDQEIGHCVAFVENIVSTVSKLCQCISCKENIAKHETMKAFGTTTKHLEKFQHQNSNSQNLGKAPLTLTLQPSPSRKQYQTIGSSSDCVSFTHSENESKRLTQIRPIVINRRYESDKTEKQDDSDTNKSPLISSQSYESSSSENSSNNLYHHGSC